MPPPRGAAPRNEAPRQNVQGGPGSQAARAHAEHRTPLSKSPRATNTTHWSVGSSAHARRAGGATAAGWRSTCCGGPPGESCVITATAAAKDTNSRSLLCREATTTRRTSRRRRLTHRTAGHRAMRRRHRARARNLATLLLAHRQVPSRWTHRTAGHRAMRRRHRARARNLATLLLAHRQVPSQPTEVWMRSFGLPPRAGDARGALHRIAPVSGG